MSYGALSPLTTGLKPAPQLRRRIIGIPAERARMPFYIGLSPNGYVTYLILPPDISYLSKILLVGPSGSGKSICIRVIIEELYREYLRSRAFWRHPIFILADFKSNYLGITSPNMRKTDVMLLRQIHGISKGLRIPEECVNIFVPAYAVPTEKDKILRELRENYGVTGIWKIPWKFIADLHWLAMVLKVPTETLWATELQPSFEKAIARVVTFNDLIKVGGVLEKACHSIRNPQTRNAGLDFVARWRKYKYAFSDTDELAEHLSDNFSINVLTFRPTAGKAYYNQLAFLIALESLMTHLQTLRKTTHPIVICHDLHNLIGEGRPFRAEITDALLRLMAGQARTLWHGYTVILEARSLEDLPLPIRRKSDYSHIFTFKWKASDPRLRGVKGFLGGIAKFEDLYHNFRRETVIIRPPRTSYVT